MQQIAPSFENIYKSTILNVPELSGGGEGDGSKNIYQDAQNCFIF